MTLYLFKYCLPVLLGYTLFVGLSGRLNPLVKPEYPEERPSWFLGLWTGMSVAIVALLGLHMAYSMPLEGVSKLLPPTALFMTVLLFPGFLGYFYYRRTVAAEFSMPFKPGTRRNLFMTAGNAPPDKPAALAAELVSDAEDIAPPSPDSIHNAQDTMRNTNTNAPAVAPILNSADLQTLDTYQQEAASNDSALFDSGYMAASDPAREDSMDDTIFEELHYSSLDLDESTLAELALTDPQSNSEAAGSPDADNDQLSSSEKTDESTDGRNEISRARLNALPEPGFVAELTCEEELLFEPELLDPDETMNSLFEPEALFAGEDINTWFEIDELTGEEQDAELFDANSTAQIGTITDNASFLSELELLESDLRLDDTDSRTRDECEQTLIDSIDEQAPSTSTLDDCLLEEKAAHRETARQLSATRHRLATLTCGTEGTEQDKTASFLQMREDLVQSQSQHGALEILVQQEASKRLELESSVVELQRNLIMSKQDTRRGTAARAKALGTANKAIAFARQTLQVRALLEEELAQTRETLTLRQNTISSLIKELEHEKERTQEEVSFMVQQLVLHEQQLKARRNLEVTSDTSDSPQAIRTIKRIETQSLSSDM